MKQIYIKSVLVVFFLLGFLKVYAQYPQYDLFEIDARTQNDVLSSGPKANLADTYATLATETGEFNWTLTYNSYDNILALQYAMERAYQAAVKRWLGQQENNLKQQIEYQMAQKFSDFKTAQLAYFKFFEDNSSGKSRGMEYVISSISSSQYSKAKDLRKLGALDLNDLYALNIRQREINSGNIINSKVGYYKIQGVYLKDVSSLSNLSKMRNLSINSYGGKEYSAALNSSWATGMNKLNIDRGRLTSEYAKNRRKQYENLSPENRILLMSVYLHISSSDFSGISVGPPRSINGVYIADYWSSSSLLAEGKKLAPGISSEARALQPGYIDEMRKNCNSNNLRNINISRIVKEDDPYSDPACIRANDMEVKGDQFIQKEIDKLHPRPATEIRNMQQFVTNTWASRSKCPGPGICWRKEIGNFEGRSSLYYNERSEATWYGRVYQNYKLGNGDIISRVQQPVSNGSVESEEVVWYLPNGGDWFEYHLPPRSYKDTDLNFLFDKFWDGAKLVGRYAIPIEDVIILIDGKDFDGLQQSRALAAGGILFTVVPGSKLLKPTAVVVKGGYQGVKVVVKEGTKTVVKNYDDLLNLSKLLTNLNKNAKFVLDGTGEFSKVGGHHPLAKIAFTSDKFYNLSKAFSVATAKLEQFGGKGVHNVITGYQNSLYSAFAKSGQRLTLQKMAEIEIEAMVKSGIPRDVATGWIIKALEDLKKQGVKFITNIPWNGTN